MSAPALPSRVLLVGDIHGAMPHLITAFQLARRLGIAAVVQLGDNWLYAPRELTKIDRQARLQGIEHYWFVDGNHENFDLLDDRVDSPTVHPLSERIAYLGRGSRFTIGSRTALALGGAVSIDRFTQGYDRDGRPIRPRREGHDWWPREAITTTDRDIAIAGGPADIMLTHDTTFEGALAVNFRLSAKGMHPVSAADDVSSRRLLTEVVATLRPTLLAHGHLHHRGSGIGRDGVRYEALDCNSRPGSMVVLDAERMSIENP